MSSSLTIKSKWRDAPWHPEVGSNLGGMYTYTLNGNTHYLGRDEQEAGERMGNQSYLDYAYGIAEPVKHARGGWEYFDERPGMRGPDMRIITFHNNGHRVWTKWEEEELMRMRKYGVSWLECAAALLRTPGGVRQKWLHLSALPDK